jgi:drug/metabolite transporter (DMT)-like permease
MEPGTYRVLINYRILFSGVLLQILFKKRLTRRQWAALLLLVLACIAEQSGSFSSDDGVFAIIMMSIQGLCSSLGSIYFQWLLQKQDSEEMGIWLKNTYLYFWSIIVNLFAIVIFRPDLLSSEIFNVRVEIVIVAGLGGVFTSLLLRHLDVIVKEYANFAEMVAVAIAQRILFGSELRFSLLAAIIMVSYSLYMYQTPGEKPKAEIHRNDLETAKSFLKGSDN